MSAVAVSEDEFLDAIRQGIEEGWLKPETRADCLVCDDLGVTYCPHLNMKEGDAIQAHSHSGQ